MQFGIPRTLYAEEHELFRETVARFLQKEVLPVYEEWEDAGKTPRSIWKRAGEVGLLGTSIPEAYGGFGGDFCFDAIVIEELGRYGVAAPAWDVHAYIIAPILEKFCSESQKQEWLPKMVSGESILAIGLTEPGGGSDLKELRTSAVGDGGEFVVNGSKTFITNGHIADYVLLAAKTAPELGAKGVSLFMLDLTLPGVSRGRNLKKIGNKAQDTAELFFTDAVVPAANLLGQEGRGFHHLVDKLPQERLSIAAAGVAAARAGLDWTVDHVKARTAFGQPIGSFQNTRFVLAEVATEVEVAQAFIDKCVVALNEGTLTAEEASMAKWWCTELQKRAIDRCLQLFGGYGYMVEYPIARAYADARVTTIYGGTTEIMKEIISKRHLGL